MPVDPETSDLVYDIDLMSLKRPRGIGSETAGTLVVLAHANWKPFGDNVPERAARLIHEKKIGPAIIVFPDCFTAVGGSVKYAKYWGPSPTTPATPASTSSTGTTGRTP